MPDSTSSRANICHLLLSFVGYFDVFPNARGPNATYVPPPPVGSRVGLVGLVRLIGTRFRSARLFGYQHVDISNTE